MADFFLLSKDDFDRFKEELFSQLKTIQECTPQSKWLRSKEVCEMLNVSPSVLQQIRINQDIPALKLSTGTWLYPYDGIIEALEANTIGRKRGES